MPLVVRVALINLVHLPFVVIAVRHVKNKSTISGWLRVIAFGTYLFGSLYPLDSLICSLSLQGGSAQLIPCIQYAQVVCAAFGALRIYLNQHYAQVDLA